MPNRLPHLLVTLIIAAVSRTTPGQGDLQLRVVESVEGDRGSLEITGRDGTWPYVLLSVRLGDEELTPEQEGHREAIAAAFPFLADRPPEDLSLVYPELVPPGQPRLAAPRALFDRAKDLALRQPFSDDRVRKFYQVIVPPPEGSEGGVTTRIWSAEPPTWEHEINGQARGHRMIDEWTALLVDHGIGGQGESDRTYAFDSLLHRAIELQDSDPELGGAMSFMNDEAVIDGTPQGLTWFSFAVLETGLTLQLQAFGMRSRSSALIIVDDEILTGSLTGLEDLILPELKLSPVAVIAFRNHGSRQPEVPVAGPHSVLAGIGADLPVMNVLPPASVTFQLADGVFHVKPLTYVRPGTWGFAATDLLVPMAGEIVAITAVSGQLLGASEPWTPLAVLP